MLKVILVGIACFENQQRSKRSLIKTDHEVDAISGATITGDGVSDMISERLAHYTPYFNLTTVKPVEEVNEEISKEEIPSKEVQTIAYQN